MTRRAFATLLFLAACARQSPPVPPQPVPSASSADASGSRQSAPDVEPVSPTPLPVAALREAALRLRMASAPAISTERRSRSGLDPQHSVVDLLKHLGMDSSLAARQRLGAQFGQPGRVDGSVAGNVWLHGQITRRYMPTAPELPRASREGTTPPPLTIPPRRILWGTSYEDNVPATEERMGALRLIGFDIVRPTVRISETNPKQNVFDWTGFERTLDSAKVVGLQVIPTLAWCPAWMSGGFPTYEEYTRGCTRWKVGATTVFDIEFNVDAPYCTNPPHLDREALRRYSVAFGMKFGRRVMAVTPGNEFGGIIYWPPMFSDSDTNDAARRAVVEFIEPIVRGIRTFNPQMQFVGPESDGADIHRRILVIEHEMGLELFDALSVHPYPTSSDPNSIYALLNEFRAAGDPVRGDRPDWYSESGGMPDILVFIREVLASGRPVSMISIGDYRQWFVPGSWERNAPVLNARGLELQALITGANVGRPARLHVESVVNPFEDCAPLRMAA